VSVSRTRYAISARRQPFGQHRLRRPDAAPELDPRPEVMQRQLEGRHARHDVEGVDVAEVREPDDLALEAILSARERDPHAIAEVAEERAAIDRFGQHDGRRGRARRFRGEQAKPQRRGGGPRRAREPVVARVDVGPALAPHHAQRDTEPIDQRDGRRPRRGALGDALPLATEVEVEARQPGLLRRRPGAR
jgi:hypothetical protein